MRFCELWVKSFRGIAEARISLDPGLNLLFGPNEAGKSTLAEAIRAVLLLKATSRSADAYLPAAGGGAPEVALTYADDEDRVFRIHKTFGERGTATLEWSRDGTSFAREASGDAADAKLREQLSWGLRSPGGRGGPKGPQETFLTRALLAEQTGVSDILRAKLEDEASALTERVQSALAAAVEDPRFKRALALAARERDRFYSQNGRRSQKQTSPWKKAQSELNAARQELDAVAEEAQKVETLEHRLREQLALESDLRGRLEDAVDERARLRALRETENHRAALGEALEEAQRELDAGLEVKTQVETLKERLEALSRDLGEQASLTEEAAKAVEAARSEREVKREALRAAETAGEGPKLKLRRAELDQAIGALDAEAERLERRAADARALAEEEQAFSRLHEQVEAALAERPVEVDRAAVAARALERLRVEVEASRALEAESAVESARARLRRAEATLTRAEEAARRVEGLKQTEREVLDRLKGKAPLDHPTLERVRKLDAELKAHRAAASAGLSLTLTRLRPVELTIEADEGPARVVVPGVERATFEAARRLELALGDWARLSVQAGSADARRALEEAEAAWAEHARPLLARHGVKTVEALAARLRALEDDRRTLAETQSKLAEATVEAEARTEAEAERRAAQQALEEAEQVRARYPERPEVTPSAPLSELEAALERARSAQQEADQALAALDARLGQLKERATEQAEAVTSARARLGAPSADVLAGVKMRSAAIEAERGAHLSEREGLLQAIETRVASALAALEQAERALSASSGASEAAREELEAIRKTHAETSGRLEGAREALSKVDLEGLRERAATAAARLSEVPPTDFRADALEAAETGAAELERALKEAEREMLETRVALDQTGGRAAKQRLEDAQARFDEKKARQEEVELEASAALLLVETLKEAERKVAKHLGVALGEEVAQRFSDLTAERYGGVEIDKHLTTQQVYLGGAGLSPGQLSVGTQHQLATLLRVILAEHIGHPILLDDQLIQSDPGRLRWFREQLVRSASKTQIIVLSCRAGDYLETGNGASPPVHVVDVSKAIRRLGEPNGTQRSSADPPWSPA